jgi:hypothetical protein
MCILGGGSVERKGELLRRGTKAWRWLVTRAYAHPALHPVVPPPSKRPDLCLSLGSPRHTQPRQGPLWDTGRAKGALLLLEPSTTSSPRPPPALRCTPTPPPPRHCDPSPHPPRHLGPSSSHSGKDAEPDSWEDGGTHLSQPPHSPPPGVSPGHTQSVGPHNAAPRIERQTFRTPAASALTRPGDPNWCARTSGNCRKSRPDLCPTPDNSGSSSVASAPMVPRVPTS